MTESAKTDVKERRGADRIPLEGSVVIKIQEAEVLGPTRNISEEGFYFIAEAELPVEIKLPGVEKPITGKVVRVGAVREQEYGIAIRFDERLDPDLLPAEED